MSEESNEEVSVTIHRKAYEKVREFVINFIKHPFKTAGDIALYMVGLSVGLWLIFSVAHLCWNMLRPFFFHHQW